MRPSVCVYVGPLKKLAVVLKFHIWIPNQNIVDPYFLSELYPLVELCPFLRVRVQFASKISRNVLTLGASK